MPEGEILSEHLPDHIQLAAPKRVEDKAATDTLLATLENCGWNISEAARALGVDRSTVHRRIKKAGIARRYSDNEVLTGKKNPP
nr:helix-turn-helix domain-containing protein [Enterovibrio coralii]